MSYVNSAALADPTRKTRVLLIGLGPHARKVYLPGLLRNPDTELVAVVELDQNEGAVVATVGPRVEVILTPAFEGSKVPPFLKARLDRAVNTLEVDAVIIATEPTAHEAYAEWALRGGLNVLVDKPIVAFPGTSHSPDRAARLATAFTSLSQLADANPGRLAAVAVQRRNHPGLRLVREIVVDASTKFGTPITAIESSHADGQFRHPIELRDLEYHGFKTGYGKLFHSGFHIVDLQAWMLQASRDAAGVSTDSLETHAFTTRPKDFLAQVPTANYASRWGEGWNEVCDKTDDELRAELEGYGELDLAATTSFESAGSTITLSQITLLHTSFSRRSWLQSRPDLYKHNGRVKHEHHNIVVGPFLTVQIHSYQSSDEHDVNTDSDYELGGNNHFVITVFRNRDWWDRSVPALEVIDIKDVAEQRNLNSARLVTNHAKTAMLDGFVDCVRGRTEIEAHPSRLQDHALGAMWIAAIAESAASRSSISKSLQNFNHQRKAA